MSRVRQESYLKSGNWIGAYDMRYEPSSSKNKVLPKGLPRQSERGQAASKAAIDATSTDYLQSAVLPRCSWSKSEGVVEETCRTDDGS